MGAYLSEPITNKETSVEENEEVRVASSSMQGWRVSQEDAHNAIINFDDKTSLFAVYDGHGGHEVAEYTAKYLPSFIKQNEDYLHGNIHKALVDSFVEFDRTIIRRDVVAELKKIVGKPEDDIEEEGEVDNLYQEATMPLEDVIAKYEAKENLEEMSSKDTSVADDSIPLLPENETDDVKENLKCEQNSESKIIKNPIVAALAGSSKPKGVSPFLRAKANPVEKNGESVSVAKEIDFDSQVANSKYQELIHSKQSIEIENDGKAQNGDNKTSSTFTQDCLHSDTIKISEDKIVSNCNGDNDASLNNQSNVLPDSNGVHTKTENFRGLSRRDVLALLEEDCEDENDDEENGNEDECIGGDFNEEPGNDSGCTAVVALVRGNELFVANAGDSRCVVCRDGKAIEMSFDHKPEDTPERDRIENAGGRVTPDGRVNGGLNLSRAIGDHAYKTNKILPLQEQMISPVPDIRTLQLDSTKDSYIVLACDGIWNSLSSQEVVDFISERMDKCCSNESDSHDPSTQQLQTICEELFDHCLAPDTINDGTGMDNMTAIIVKLRPTFDGNKSAKDMLPTAGSSSSKNVSSPKLPSSNISSCTPCNPSTEKVIVDSDKLSANGDATKSLNPKRIHEDSELSPITEPPCGKKAKIDEDKQSNDTNSSQVTSLKAELCCD